MAARFLFCFVLVVNCYAETRYVHKDINKFLYALNMVEASGKSGNIIGDNGKALGGYQIWRPYYQDAVKASKGALNKSYYDVTDAKYAREVVLWYFYRYAKNDLENGNWENLAKLHRIGPNWRNKESLGDKYWLKVKKFLLDK